MGGTASEGYIRSGMHEHLTNFLDNFFLSGKSAASVAIIKMGSGPSSAGPELCRISERNGGQPGEVGRLSRTGTTKFSRICGVEFAATDAGTHVFFRMVLQKDSPHLNGRG